MLKMALYLDSSLRSERLVEIVKQSDVALLPETRDGQFPDFELGHCATNGDERFHGKASAVAVGHAEGIVDRNHNLVVTFARLRPSQPYLILPIMAGDVCYHLQIIDRRNINNDFR